MKNILQRNIFQPLGVYKFVSFKKKVDVRTKIHTFFESTLLIVSHHPTF